MLALAAKMVLQLTLKKISRQIILKKIIFMLLPFVKKIL